MLCATVADPTHDDIRPVTEDGHVRQCAARGGGQQTVSLHPRPVLLIACEFLGAVYLGQRILFVLREPPVIHDPAGQRERAAVHAILGVIRPAVESAYCCLAIYNQTQAAPRAG